MMDSTYVSFERNPLASSPQTSSPPPLHKKKVVSVFDRFIEVYSHQSACKNNDGRFPAVRKVVTGAVRDKTIVTATYKEPSVAETHFPHLEMSLSIFSQTQSDSKPPLRGKLDCQPEKSSKNSIAMKENGEFNISHQEIYEKNENETSSTISPTTPFVNLSLDDPGFIVRDLEYDDHLLGEGSFSRVFKIQKINAISPLTPLVIKISRSSKDCIESLNSEYQLLTVLARNPEISPHILPCKKYLKFQYGRIGLIFDRAVGALDKTLKSMRDLNRNLYTLSEIKLITKRFLSVLKALHGISITHADFKPQNILEKRGGRLYLADFGSCFHGAINNEYIVSRWYRAPEIFLEAPLDSKIDVWSLGCVIYEIFTLEVLFPIQENSLSFIQKFESYLGSWPEDYLKDSKVWQFYSQQNLSITEKNQLVNRVKERWQSLHYGSNEELISFTDFLKGLLAIDPKRRLSAAEAYVHPFLANIHL